MSDAQAELKFSLIMTIFNEKDTVQGFLTGLRDWTRLPDEMVIVDGGSNDGTVEIIRSFIPFSPVPILFIEEMKCNIPKGRNIAVQRATYDYIVGTDMGCLVPSDWFEKITTPFFEDGRTDVVGGYYQPLCTERIHYAYHYLTHRSKFDDGFFLISHRSIAYKKAVWEKVGGYPEYIQAGEDTLFDIRARDLGFVHVYAPEAKVAWEQKNSIWMYGYMHFRYSRGAGRALIRPHWYLFYYLNYALFLFWAFATVAWGLHFLVPMFVHVVVYAWFRIFRKPLTRAHLAPAYLAYYFLLTLAVDIGTMCGYPTGIIKRILGRNESWIPSRDKAKAST